MTNKETLKQIERDMLEAIKNLTTARTAKEVTASSLRDVATRTEAISGRLWGAVNELEDDGVPEYTADGDLDQGSPNHFNPDKRGFQPK